MKWRIGDRVLAHWSHDSFWYPATVKKIEGERIYLRFDDGDKEWTHSEQLMKLEIKSGDRVYGRYKKGPAYYPGYIRNVQGEEIQVQYDDGDEEWTTLAMLRMVPDVPIKWKAGDRVLAQLPPDIFWYPGVIANIDHSHILVHCDDGAKVCTTWEHITELDIELDDRIFGRWKAGQFYYPGYVGDKKDDQVYIHYDDGDKEWTNIGMIRVTR